jgi:hypothetical protein
MNGRAVYRSFVGSGFHRIGACGADWIVCAICLALALGATVPPAAAEGGTVMGIAKDALERPLPGADLRLETTDGQVVGRTTTDDQGRFTFTDVASGTYAVVGEKEGFETASAVVTISDGVGATTELTLASKEPLSVRVMAQRLEEARISIQPRIGASTYEITREVIEKQPGGDNNTLTQVLLQAPGVTQDSSQSGYLHVRNEHANVQYRINGVALPEGVSLFGQSGGLSPRFASKVDLITGALPAEYGLRTAGIVDVQTKSGTFEPGGYVGIYGGSQSWLQPSFEYGGSYGRFNYFVAGDYLQNSIGLSPATPNGPIHDDTQQGHGFGYVEYLLDPSSKVSAIAGAFVGHFQIPTSPGGTPAFTVDGISDFPSAKIDQTQLEQNYYAVLSYLKTMPDLVYQISAFTRYSGLTFHPDPLPDVIFNGIAQHYDRTSIAGGLQAEGSYTLTPNHTLRAGVLVSVERATVTTTSSVLPAMDGMQTAETPVTIFDTTDKTGVTESFYLQDAWRILPSVTINGGLRLDLLQAFTDDWQLSPRLNVVWTATPTTTIHAGYARYFTPPPLIFTSTTTLNKFADTTAAPEVPQNTTIKPERAHYIDVGLTQRIVPGLTVGLDSYYKQADHLLDDGQFGAPVLLTPFNYTKGYNWGVELTSSYAAGNFTGYINLAFGQQRATRVEAAQALFSADDLAFIADHYISTDHAQLITASGGLSYLWNRTRFSVDFLAGSGLRRTVTTPNDSTVPGYTQVNLGVTHSFTLGALGPFEARFDVINLLDNNYEIRDGTGVGVFAKQFGPPRGFFVGLKKVF